MLSHDETEPLLTTGPPAAERSEPWLSDRQQRVWRTWLTMWRMVSDRIERDMQQTGGMPHAYYLILAMLSEAPNGRLRMNRLADVVNSSQSRLSHAVARLEELGWVRREQASADKRGQVAILTPAGYDRLVAVAPLHAETVRSMMFDPLNDEQLDDLESILLAVLNARPAESAAARLATPSPGDPDPDQAP